MSEAEKIIGTMHVTQELGFSDEDHLFKLSLMYHEKISIALIKEYEKEYFILKAQDQVETQRLSGMKIRNFIENKMKTSDDHIGDLNKSLVNDFLSQIENIKLLKQKEIQHFEQKIFTINHQI